MDNKFERRPKADQPVLAICYDFDKTLSPDDMQAQGYIQSVGYDIGTFWRESNDLAENNDMDQNLAYMLKMVEESEGKFAVNREKLREYGSKVELFPGVESWFSRIRDYGKEKGVIVEHYIISSGLKEMIEGTSVAKEFERIYASSYYFNEKGAAKWPAQVVNYTNKTQFLFRIEKGTLDVNDTMVNDAFAPEDIRVPFRNMVYIGDSDTDIPCMKLVNSYGGHSIGVYNGEKQDKTKVNKMMRDGRIKYYVAADYSADSELDGLVKAIIDRTAANEALESKYYACKKETAESDRLSSEDEQKRQGLMIALESSRSFATTHSLIADLRTIKEWTIEDKENLFEIAIKNGQVLYILGDPDVKAFYRQLLKGYAGTSDFAKEVHDLLTQE